ncbi:MAG: alpha/beta fold hydrolase, partial [Burkholderiaceae bacterium]
IRPGNAKGIGWHAQAHARTPWSVVYLHGFSASRLETAPLADQVARRLGANLFYSRLTGHGRTTLAAMGEASVQDWLADALEALRIGQILGDRVLMIGCSTGATLATWLTLRPEGQALAALVFLSPNFGPRNKRANIINAPWGRQIALALQGETRSWEPSSPGEANAWTTRYPTRALFPMMALVHRVRRADMAAFQTPVLMLYSEQDQTVDPRQTRQVFARIASAHKQAIVVDYSGSLGQHVLAGDILAPQATAPMVDSIVAWVRKLP